MLPDYDAEPRRLCVVELCEVLEAHLHNRMTLLATVKQDHMIGRPTKEIASQVDLGGGLMMRRDRWQICPQPDDPYA